MRRLLLVVVLACLAGIAGADEIWLKDGRRIVTKKPLVQKGGLALLTTTDGVLMSIPLSEIDVARTAAEKSRAAAATPVPTASVPKPLTPAEAAKQKSGRRAAVVLTDDSVAHGIGEESVEKKEGSGEGRVDVANTSATKTKDGYSFSGSVINSGASEVSGVSVTVEVVGKDGKTSSSAFAQLAKDALEPGEKSTFTASTSMEGEAASYRYVPRWQVRIPVKTASDSKTPGGSAPKPVAEGEPTPAPTPPPAPTLVPIPRSDVAPPAANAPTGNPADGTFIPQNDSSTTSPKPPGT
ncbi:MAG: FxLYD domain-containing protein [Thermoanaerobaculia bacterium]